MLSDHQHGIDGEFAPAAPQCFGNRRIHLKIKFLCSCGALVALRFLIDVQRHHFHVRLVPDAISRVADEKSIADVLRVREVAINGRDDGDPFHDYSEGLRPSDSPARSLAGARQPRSARVGSLARSFAKRATTVWKPNQPNAKAALLSLRCRDPGSDPYSSVARVFCPCSSVFFRGSCRLSVFFRVFPWLVFLSVLIRVFPCLSAPCSSVS
jgi:hypothetical protein